MISKNASLCRVFANRVIYILCDTYELFVTGIPPEIVPNVTYVIAEVDSPHFAIILNWEEPFNNFDPILNYTVSYSGDYITCSQCHHTTNDNSTRNYTVRRLTLMRNYTFLVVANNSFGSGKAGEAMIITPGEVTLHEYICSYYYFVYLASYVCIYVTNQLVLINC